MVSQTTLSATLSALAHNKLALLSAYNYIYKYDIICIFETFLLKLSSTHSNILIINRHNFVRADHPDNMKKGGLCWYFKEMLQLRQINTSFCPKCLLCEVTIDNTVGCVSVICRSLSQPAEKFKEFSETFW